MARERDDMTAAVNYAIGYLDALSGWATGANERESARMASEAIRDYAASVRAARLERDARERDDDAG
jgi:hypothetical protein